MYCDKKEFVEESQGKGILLHVYIFLNVKQRKGLYIGQTIWQFGQEIVTLKKHDDPDNAWSAPTVTE